MIGAVGAVLLCLATATGTFIYKNKKLYFTPPEDTKPSSELGAGKVVAPDSFSSAVVESLDDVL